MYSTFALASVCVQSFDRGAPRTAEFGACPVKVGFEPAGRRDDPGAFRIRFAETER